MWQTNRARNPDRELRNAEDYYVPPHRIELVKRLPLTAFPTAWNAEKGDKLNPVKHVKFVVNFLNYCLDLYSNMFLGRLQRSIPQH